MKLRTVAFGLASACVLIGSAQAQSINIPLGPDIYGNGAAYSGGTLTGYNQSAQSFIATGSQLASVSTPMYQQFGGEAFFWQYQLWSDLNGKPDQVIATFGSFDPTLTLTYFSAAPTTQIALTPGARYYLGFAPDPSKVPAGDGESYFVTAGWRETSTQDAYAAGTVWAIANPGPVGEVLLQPSSFDYSMQISMVPEPAPVWLLMLGSFGALLSTARRRSAGHLAG